MSDKTEEQLFLLMTHAQDLQKAVEQQTQALAGAARRLEQDAAAVFSAAIRDNVSKTLGDARKELTEAVQAVKEASEIARSGSRRFLKLVTVYASLVLLAVSLGIGGFSWFFVSWKAEEAVELRAEIRAMNADLAKLPKVYSNIQDTPGHWVVIDPAGKTLQLQSGETIARLPRR